MSEEQRLVRHASRMAVVTLFCRVSGYLRDKALSWALGAGNLNDAYRMANRIPNAFRALFAEGSLHAAFVPMMAQLTGEDGDREKARELFRGLLAALMLLLSVVVCLGIFFAPFLVGLYGRGFEAIPGKLELTVFMNRIMFPYLGFISLAALLQGVLNSHERFLLSASTPIFFNLTVAGVGWLAVPNTENPSVILSLAVLVGGVLQFAVQAPAVHRLGFALVPAWKLMRSPEVKQVLLLMLPGIPVLGINQLNQFITSRFASFLGEGGFTVVYYSYRVTELVFGLVVVQLTTVLLPVLSRELRASPQSASKTLVRTIEMVSFVTLPAATVMLILPRPIIGFLFGGGRFSTDAVTMTGATLSAYALSVVGTAQVKVMASAFFAQKNTKTPMWGSLVALVVFTSMCWLVVDPLGAPGLGWANTIAMACYASFLTALYGRTYGFGGMRLGPVVVTVGRQLVACGVVALGLLQARAWLWDIERTSLSGAWKLAAVLLPGALAYAAVVSLLGGPEVRALVTAVLRKERS